MPTTLAANIAALRQHLSLKQAAFAERVGVNQSYVSKWENQGKVPEISSLERLADLAGVSTRQFRDEKWAPRIAAGYRGDAPEQPRVLAVDSGETVAIQRLDLSLAMGAGTNIDDYIEVDTVEFDRAFLRSLTPSQPSMIRLISGVGDSMFPTLLDTDQMFLDVGQRVLNMQDRIWGISLYGAGALKRLRAIGKSKVLVISDHPDVPNQDVHVDDLAIAGRLVGAFRRH